MRLALSILLLAAPLAAQRPTDAEASALIEKARLRALQYTSSLPDFLCTQTVRRFQDPRGDNRWQRIDVLTVKLSFSERREDYKLLAVDGKPTGREYMEVGGPTSKGEFGSLLLYLFHPKIEAEFHWKGWTNIHRRRAALYTYKVDQQHTQFHVSYGPMSEGPYHILAPYFGEVGVDPESGEVLRIVQHAVLPAMFPIRESSATVDYDIAEVGGRKYLLPRHAEVSMAASRSISRGVSLYKTRNDVDFTEYRKFQTDTTISFDK